MVGILLNSCSPVFHSEPLIMCTVPVWTRYSYGSFRETSETTEFNLDFSAFELRPARLDEFGPQRIRYRADCPRGTSRSTVTMPQFSTGKLSATLNCQIC